MAKELPVTKEEKAAIRARVKGTDPKPTKFYLRIMLLKAMIPGARPPFAPH